MNLQISPALLSVIVLSVGALVILAFTTPLTRNTLWLSTLGGLVIIRHGDAWTTVYGHASQLLVRRGQAVKKGQMIALSGNSGSADRPALHFEIRQGRTPVDPIPRLPKR